MTKQQIKIEFKTNYNFSVGDICDFKSKDNTISFKGIYIDKSRIDKFPIFIIDKFPIIDLKEFTVNGYQIKEYWVIKQLNDIQFDNNVDENKNKIIDYLFELHNINQYDLTKKDAYKSIIRNLKIGSIF